MQVLDETHQPAVTIRLKQVTAEGWQLAPLQAQQNGIADGGNHFVLPLAGLDGILGSLDPQSVFIILMTLFHFDWYILFFHSNPSNTAFSLRSPLK